MLGNGKYGAQSAVVSISSAFGMIHTRCGLNASRHDWELEIGSSQGSAPKTVERLFTFVPHPQDLRFSMTLDNGQPGLYLPSDPSLFPRVTFSGVGWKSWR